MTKPSELLAEAYWIWLLIVRQIGNLASCLLHAEEEGEEVAVGRIAHMKSELGDLTALVMWMCEVLELDYGEVVRIARQMRRERLGKEQ